MQYFRAYFIVFLMGLTACFAWAAPAGDSRGFRGTVQDTSGAVIAGAQVVVAAQDGKTAAKGRTDNSGSFHLGDLPAGIYFITVTKEGFREVKQPVTIGSAGHAPLRIVLPVAALAENITVEASDTSAQISTAIAQNQSGNTVDANALDRLPVFDHDYISAMSRFLDPDSSGTNGTTLVVNGVEANGPGVTASAIESVRVNQIPIRRCIRGQVGPGLRSPRREARRSSTVPETSCIAILCSTPRTPLRLPSQPSSGHISKVPSRVLSAITRRQRSC